MQEVLRGIGIVGAELAVQTLTGGAGAAEAASEFGQRGLPQGRGNGRRTGVSDRR